MKIWRWVAGAAILLGLTLLPGAGSGSQSQEAPPAAAISADGPGISDQELLRLKQQRFGERVDRVLQVMRRERVDFRAVPYLTADGRVAARVTPVDTEETDGQ